MADLRYSCDYAKITTNGNIQAVWTTWNMETLTTDTAVWPVSTISATTTTNTATTVWVNWNGVVYNTTAATELRRGQVLTADDVLYAEIRDVPEVPITPEEAARRAEAAREHEEKLRIEAKEAKRKLEEAKRLRIAAEERARKLLLEVLDEQQRDEYEKSKGFHVIDRDGTRYHIGCRRTGNVTELDVNGKAKARYCIHPREDVPNEDTMVMQKLMLECEPERFKSVANKTVLPTASVA